MNRKNLIQREFNNFNQLRRNFFNDLLSPLESTLFPEISNTLGINNFSGELKEDNDNYYINAELAGVNKEDINLDISDNKVSIRAEKKEEKEENNKKSHFSEIYYGSFFQSYPLSTPVDVDNVKATFKNGVLRLKIPKLVNNEKVKKIDIE